MRRSAGHVGMLENIAAAVDTRSFSVPHRKHAVVLRTGEKIDLLRAPDAGCGHILVHTGLKPDPIRIQVRLSLDSGLIDAAQRRAAVAADEPRRVQPGAYIALPLQHR